MIPWVEGPPPFVPLLLQRLASEEQQFHAQAKVIVEQVEAARKRLGRGVHVVTRELLIQLVEQQRDPDSRLETREEVMKSLGLPFDVPARTTDMFMKAFRQARELPPPARRPADSIFDSYLNLSPLRSPIK